MTGPRTVNPPTNTALTMPTWHTIDHSQVREVNVRHPSRSSGRMPVRVTGGSRPNRMPLRSAAATA